MTMAATMPSGARPEAMSGEHKKVIFASSLGTVFEWYDFYIYGTLATNIAATFFSGVNPTAGFIFALLSFAAGFAVRPFGALVFGRLGDLVGRKYTFLVTMTLMGLATFAIGFLPSYGSIGIAAPAILIGLRLVQGLALGGEYGGAATYVAEYAPHGRRGFYTSWIQTTATLGLFVALLLIQVVQHMMSPEAFKATDLSGGWRIPFMLSIVLLGVSIWIRLSLAESPAFLKMKSEGSGSRAPLSEAFGEWKHAKVAILALFGLVAGQAVVWYTGQFYALFFLTKIVKVESVTAGQLIAIALAIGTPGFLLFGWLSDKIGRKPIILAGCLLAALTYFPLFHALTAAANPDLANALAKSAITVTADPSQCSFQFNPTTTASFTSSCDIAKSQLATAGVNYTNVTAPAGTVASIKVGDTDIAAFDGTGMEPAALKAKTAGFAKTLTAATAAHGYPAKADPAKMNTFLVVAILVVLMVYVTMVYGPMAATLVELFPTRIRYSGMSLPYHIGNGWFGGFLPPIVFAIVAAVGDIYSGLWYPIGVALMTFVIGLVFIPETKNRNINAID